MLSRVWAPAGPLRAVGRKPLRVAQSLRHESTQSSTTAIAYKLSHPHAGSVRPPPRKRFVAPPQLTAEEAVSNILYNTQTEKKDQARKHILDCLAQDEPGVLSRVTGIMAARGYNIDTLVASKTEVPGLSRMTIVLKGERVIMEQAKRQLEDLVPIWAVLDYSDTKLIQRELLLAKVSILGPEHALEQLRDYRHSKEELAHPVNYQEVKEVHQGSSETAASNAKQLSPEAAADPTGEELAANHTESLLYSHHNLHALKELTELFQGRIVDVSAESMAIELSAKSDRVDAFLSLIRPFGILEAVRSGLMVLPRSQRLSIYQDEEVAEVPADNNDVDVSALPPG